VSGVSTPGVVVLGIQGSPRRGGNTDHMLEAALEGARKCGANTSVLVASEAGMRPCCGCNQCIRTGQCVQLDSGSNVYARLDTADAIIVASPVYFASVPAVLKSSSTGCSLIGHGVLSLAGLRVCAGQAAYCLRAVEGTRMAFQQLRPRSAVRLQCSNWT